jgi:hypothetical protein
MTPTVDELRRWIAFWTDARQRVGRHEWPAYEALVARLTAQLLARTEGERL